MIGYTTVGTAIWRELREAGVGAAARSLALALATDATMSPAGITSIAWERWSALTAFEVDEVRRGLDELEEAGFVVADRDTGEVLLVAYWSWNHSRTYGARIRDYTHQTVSDRVRAAALGR